MAGFSDFLEDKILNHCFRNTAYTQPATVYCALYTAAPSDTGGGTEVSGNGYARTAITFGAPSPSGTITNSGAVTFPTASGSWGTVTHFGVFDASSAGNLMGWAALSASKAVGTNDTPSFAASTLTITQD